MANHVYRADFRSSANVDGASWACQDVRALIVSITSCLRDLSGHSLKSNSRREFLSDSEVETPRDDGGPVPVNECLKVAMIPSPEDLSF